MFWKIISLQKLLDSLFDDSWCALRLPEGHGCNDLQVAD
jgi:hypothetical protein